MKKITLLIAILFSAVAFAQFSEDFEGSAGLPSGWTAVNGGDANTWRIIDLSDLGVVTAHSGVNVVGIDYHRNAHDDYLVTPAITVTAGVNDYFSFWGRSREPLHPETIDVKLSATGTAAANFNVTLLTAVAPPSGLVFYKYSIDLSAYVGQTVYIGFYSATTNQFYFDIDDVVSGALPSCREPNQVEVSNISLNTATLSWVTVGLGTNFQIEYGPEGFVLGTGTRLDVVGGLPVILPNLVGGTKYDVYIRTNCGNGNFSTWVSTSFSTSITNDDCDGAIALTVGNSFESGSYTATTVSASSGDLDPDCEIFAANDVWFSVVVPADGNLIIQTGAVAGSQNEDTILAVYSGICGALTPINCNDDINFDNNFSLLNLRGLTPGDTLYIGVWQHDNVFGYIPGPFQISVFNTTLGTDHFTNSNFRYFPNPVKDVLNISNDDSISSVAIYNLLGQQVLSQNVRANEVKLDVSSLAQGNYLVKVYADNTVKVVKLCKR